MLLRVARAKQLSFHLASRIAVRSFAALPPHTIVNMPSLSPTMTSGSIGKWLLKEGDKFEAGQSICEVETDKASVSFDATDEGYVAKILVGTEEIKCGEPIMVTVEEASDVSAFANFTLEAAAPPAPASSSSSSSPGSTPSPPPPPAEEPRNVRMAESSPPPSSTTASDRVFASPLARKMLREANIQVPIEEISISGTGPKGRIVAEDVAAYLSRATSETSKSAARASSETASQTKTSSASKASPSASSSSQSSSQAVNDAFVEYELSGAAAHRALAASIAKQTVPHYYLSVDIDVEKVLSMRAALNAGLEESHAVSVMDFMIKAAAIAMKQVPEMNSSWMESFVRKYSQVDINVFMGSGENVHAPLLRDVVSKGLGSIAAELAESALKPPAAEIQPGTFAVHNLGMFGIKSFAPIILSPQGGALALGAIQDTVVPNETAKEGDDNWKVSPMMVVTLSCDHRVVDGAVGAAWLSAFKNLVENPSTLLL